MERQDVEDPGLEQDPVALVEQSATLYSIGGGATAEKFQAELDKVLANIKDPNTEAEDRRTVTLKFVFHPTADRAEVMVAISANSSLPACKPSSDHMYIGKRNGELIGVVVHPHQDPRQGVLPLAGKKVENG